MVWVESIVYFGYIPIFSIILVNKGVIILIDEDQLFEKLDGLSKRLDALINRINTPKNAENQAYKELREEKVEGKIEDWIEIFTKKALYGTVPGLLLWLIAIGLGFKVWLDGLFIGYDLVYNPETHTPLANIADLKAFLFTVGLFGVIGGFIRQFVNVFYKFYQAQTIKGLDLKPFTNVPNKNAPNPVEIGKVRRLLNSSPINILFFRPVFSPPLGAIVAMFSVLALYGFNADLPRVIIVSLGSGAIAPQFVKWVIRKAGSTLSTLY